METPHLHHEIEALLVKLGAADRPSMRLSTPAAARSRPLPMSTLFGAPPSCRFEDFSVAASDGFEIPVRLYLPEGTPKGLIVYCHGGGWVLGSVAAFHPLTATLAQRTGCAVLSVDYRLAPENPYPAALEDTRAALAWAARDAAGAMGTQPRALVVMGDSAGANLVTIAARMHQRSTPKRQVDLQVLVYPVCDHDFQTGSYREFAAGYLLTRDDMMWFWDQYCPDPARRDDPTLSPLRAPDLSGSPPALILTAGSDPLRDEGEAYGARLAQAGVTVDTVRCDGLVHGFLSMINQATSAACAFDRVVAAIMRAATTD